MAAVGKISRVRGILFDFDNTLVPSIEADLYAFLKVKEKLLEYFPTKSVDVIAAKYQSLVTEKPVDPLRKVDPHQWRIKLWEKSLNGNDDAAFSKKPQAVEMYELWRSSRIQKIAFTEEIAELIGELAKKYKIAIVTNSDPVIQKQKLAACGAEKFFKIIVISGEQPYPKPHPSIFHTACAMISVPTENCVMVGDSLEHDIKGGKNAGLLASVWVRLKGSSWCEEDPMPDFVVDSVLDLSKILDELDSR